MRGLSCCLFIVPPQGVLPSPWLTSRVSLVYESFLPRHPVVHDFDEMLESESSEASERMSSKAVDVRAKPTLREQYFTDRSGIAPAAFLSLCLSLSWSAALVTCQVASTWKDLLASLWNEERAYSFDERGEGRRWNR